MRLTWSLSIFLCAAALSRPAAREWETRGFEAFRKGQFDSGGFNLYVSQKGILQTIHRFDVNHDGHFDLIFNNTHDLRYMVPAYRYRFSPGKRTTPERYEYPGAGSVRVRAADLDQDGQTELVIARGFDNTSNLLNSWIYWGGAAGWSGKRHTELPSHYVQDLCVADLNSDGRADLFFLASSAVGVNTSSIYWGEDAGYVYAHRKLLETPHAFGCLADDLDGDGHVDLLVAGTARSTRVFWGGPKGVDFSASTAVPVAEARSPAAAGGRLFLATAKGIEVRRVRGHSFEPELTLALEGASALTLSDLNRDGVLDLVAARTAVARNWETPSRIFWGSRKNGELTFAASAYQDLPTLSALGVAVSDLDADGYPDIVFANSRTYLSYDIPSYVYWGGPSGYGVERRSELPTHGAQAVSISGHDVFFANSIQGRPIGDIDTYVYLGGADGSFSESRMQRLPTIGGYESCISDFNDDGYTDVLLVGSHEGDLGGAAGSWIFWGDQKGVSASRKSEIATRGAIGCAAGDVNRDGYLDLLFSNMDDDTAGLFYGGADGFRRERELRLKVSEPRFPAIADLNRDGWPDLLVPSAKDGLFVFWGSSSGFDQNRYLLLPGSTTVSQQIADLNGDGYLDLIVCNLMDTQTRAYHGINTRIYWGSPSGFHPKAATELPSLGAHHATVRDFNRDSFLDIFISNYQSEFTRSLDSHIYWGNRESNYSEWSRKALHNESAAGVVSGDFNGDGWIDLAVSNHVENGDHHAKSLVFWNGPNGFDERRTTALPTIGPHMMTGVDQGNLYTREPRETYTSEIHDAGGPAAVVELDWAGTTPFGSKVAFEIRGAASAEALEQAAWQSLGTHSAAETRLPVRTPLKARYWQYRAILEDGLASSPTIHSIVLKFSDTP